MPLLSDSEAHGGWGIKKFNLDDLYVRFFRLAERRIAEMTGRGVVCYISNSSWVTGPSFVIVREHLLGSFNRVWIENLHGDRKRSEYAPDGRTSETIFAVPGFSPGIQQGVATTLWVKVGTSSPAVVLFRDDFNMAKAADRRAQMLKGLEEPDFLSDDHLLAPDAIAIPGKWDRACTPDASARATGRTDGTAGAGGIMTKTSRQALSSLDCRGQSAGIEKVQTLTTAVCAAL